MKQLSTGKIPIGLLKDTVLRLTGASSSSVVTKAKAGVDFAAVKMGGGYLIVSTDPITGIVEDIGKYAVKVSANDVATSGNRPQFAESLVLLPEGSSEAQVRTISMQIHKAATDSGITILGGHTEVTPRLDRPIVAMTVFSFVKSFVSSEGARSGDAILMTKTAGLEGTAELARERGMLPSSMSLSRRKQAARLSEKIAITEEALAAYQTGAVHAMHDCTEGGVLGAVFEMSLASELGFLLDEAAVPVARVTREICSILRLDPLRLIGSGSLLLAVGQEDVDLVKDAIRPHAKVSTIGEFRKGERILRTKEGSEKVVRDAPEDELWRALRGSAHRSNRS